jgi:hypothetical protein
MLHFGKTNGTIQVTMTAFKEQSLESVLGTLSTLESRSPPDALWAEMVDIDSKEDLIAFARGVDIPIAKANRGSFFYLFIFFIPLKTTK